MNILLTGGAGFIGSNIADAYLSEGHEVVIIDDLSTGRMKNVNPKANFVEMDIRSLELERLFREYNIQFVNHQAARGDVRASIERPGEYADVNIRGGINLLECCRKCDVLGIIYSSTGGCVYGEPRQVPTSESHPMQPKDPYGASKACFEIYLQMYQQLYGVNYTIFRYPNVYGPRQNPFGEAGVVGIFAKRMLDRKLITINGSGTQERDFVFVEDVVRANILATTKPQNDVYNLGSGVGTSVQTVYETLRKIVGYDGVASRAPEKVGEVLRSVLCAEKVWNAMGWKAAVSLQKGLERTVEYVRTES